MNRLVVGLFLGICLFAAPVIAGDIDMRGKLNVRGQAKLYKPADQLTVTIGVISQAKTAESALNDNNEKMNKVLSSLMGKGIKKEELETGRFSIDPVWSNPPKGSQDESWTPSITAYRVTNNITLKSSHLDKAGEYLDAAAKSGANSVGNIEFGIKDALAFRSEAITAASVNAIGDAKTLANATQQKLVRVLEVSLDEPHFSPVTMRSSNLMMEKSMGYGGQIPINAGQVEISASVSMIYEIAP